MAPARRPIDETSQDGRYVDFARITVAAGQFHAYSIGVGDLRSSARRDPMSGERG